MQILSGLVVVRWRKAIALGSVILTVLLVTACSHQQNRTVNKITQDTKQAAEDFDTSLTFNSVTLEEFDAKGRLWWKVKAQQASYSRDKKIARIQQPTGEFYQDGKAILQVSAQSGEVQQDGQTISLRGKIVATDLRDGAVLRGDELEWKPQKDIVILRGNLIGTRQRLTVASRQGTFFTRLRRIELMGQVMAESNDPSARFRSEHVIWQLNQETLASDRPLQIDRVVNNAVTDRATANQGFVDLKAKTASLKQRAQVSLADPPVQLGSDELFWDLNAKTVVSNQAITLVNSKQQVTLTASQGRMDIASKILYLEGNVVGVSATNQAQVTGDRLTWYSGTEQFEAEGNVVYRQVNPLLNLTGPRASGRLSDQSVVVNGGRVTTEFIPEQVGKSGL